MSSHPSCFILPKSRLQSCRNYIAEEHWEVHLQAEMRSKLISCLPLWQGIILTRVLSHCFDTSVFFQVITCQRISTDQGWNTGTPEISHTFSFWYQGFGIGLKQVYLLAQNSFDDSMRYSTSLPNTLPIVCYFLSPWWKLYFMYSMLFDTPSTPSAFLKGGG